MDIENIKERLRKKIERQRGNPMKTPRLSQIHICPRYQWFSLEQEQTEDLETCAHFLKGLLWEGWVRKCFPEAEYQREVSLCGVKGHIDFFFPDLVTVLEIKATSSAAIPFLPEEKHLWQVRAYMVALMGEGFKAPKGFILYIPSDEPFKMLDLIFPVDLQSWMIDELVKRARELKAAFESGVEPQIPQDYSPEKEPCVGVSYGKPFICPFHQTCWGASGNQIVRRRDLAAIDKVGEIVGYLEIINEKVKALMDFKEQVEERVRAYLHSNEDIKAVELAGNKWKLVAVKSNNGRETVDREALERELGKEEVKRFLKKTKPSVRIRWERI